MLHHEALRSTSPYKRKIPTDYRWKKIITGTQIQLMKLLKEHHKTVCASLHSQFEEVERELSHSSSGNTPTQAILILNNKVKVLETGLADKKRRKLSQLVKEKPKPRNRRPRHRAPPTPRDPPTRQDAASPGTVVNLSGVDLSPSELSLLSKGLKFASKPPRVNRFQLKQDLDDFGRRIRLREFFFHPEASDDGGDYREERRFKEKSKWTPGYNN